MAQLDDPSDAQRPAKPTSQVPALHRSELFADNSLVGTVFCRSYSRRVDEWLAALWADRIEDVPGVALVATGGYGRGTLSPQSDLDVMLLHERTDPDRLASLAELLWYPVWDEGIKLGHSVRSVRETVRLAREDLDTATSLVSMRRLAGDRNVVNDLAEAAEKQWRKQARKWLPELAAAAEERRRSAGEVAFLLEPDLKNSGGGLRDVHSLDWFRAADVELLDAEQADVRDAHETLLAARVELHRSSGRPGDRLLLEEQDAVADALGYIDANEFMSAISRAGRTIAWIADDVFARSGRQLRRWWQFGSGTGPSVSPGITLDHGTVHVGPSVPLGDPATVLKVALTAVRHEARMDRGSLDRMVSHRDRTPQPWTPEIQTLVVDLLSEGRAAIPVIEALDQVGVMVDLIPEWEPSRAKPQRNAYHTFTVDRHLLETACNASYLTDQVSRPDLLVVGALLHDIGKGYPGDHTVVGMKMLKTMGPRMGFDQADTETLIAMIEHHLLLPDIATRRDIEDEDTIALVAAEVESVEVLHLLGALTEADSLATGPSAWSSWKAQLVSDLVRRTETRLRGKASTSPSPGIDPEDQALLAAGKHRIDVSDDAVVAVLDDRVGMVGQVAGALAVAGIDVRSASFVSSDGLALQRFSVESVLEGEVDKDRVRSLIERAITGELDISAELTERTRAYRQRSSSPQPVVETHVNIDTDTSSWATIIEVGAPDLLGLLHVIASTLAAHGFDIGQARVHSLGDHVVDAFYVTHLNGGKVTDPATLNGLKDAILKAVHQLEAERSAAVGPS